MYDLLPLFEYDKLISWHQKHGRTHLPWRHLDTMNEKDRGYRVWISEIFLQQTQADRVIDFYNRVLERFPTVESLATTDYETFFPYYQGLGYYTRARNLLACAKIIHEKYDGIFPTETALLVSLPGIGPYTAEAIRAFVYNISTLSFDTNLEKVYSRYYLGSRFIKLNPTQKSEILAQFQNTTYSSQLINGALMDFASLYSKNSKDTVVHSESPFTHCQFKNTQGDLEISVKKIIQYFPQKDAQIEVILHKDHKIYYSSSKTEYCSFYLPPTQENIRKYVQEVFRTQYWLEVSVRPVHLKEYRNNIPFVSMYAQIQTGSSGFSTYSSMAGASEMGTKIPRIL